MKCDTTGNQVITLSVISMFMLQSNTSFSSTTIMYLYNTMSNQQNDRQKGKYRDRERGIRRHRQTDRQRDRYTDMQTDRPAGMVGSRV